MASKDEVPKTGKGLVVCFGEMLIDLVPTVSGVSLADAPGFLKAPGGAPANVAIAVSRLGGTADFIGKLGHDEFGHMLAGILKKNGLRGEGITFDEGARTALAFVTLRHDGEREFVFYRNPSADMLLQPHELNLHLIRQVYICQFSFFCSFASSLAYTHACMHDACNYISYVLLLIFLWKRPCRLSNAMCHEKIFTKLNIKRNDISTPKYHIYTLII